MFLGGPLGQELGWVGLSVCRLFVSLLYHCAITVALICHKVALGMSNRYLKIVSHIYWKIVWNLFFILDPDDDSDTAVVGVKCEFIKKAVSWKIERSTGNGRGQAGGGVEGMAESS